VIKTDQINSGVRSRDIPLERMLMIVVMKLIDPKIDEIPARWSEKIVISTDAPEWAEFAANGGYTVQPVPAPFSIIDELMSNRIDGGSNQKLMLLSRGKAMSGAPIINGINQFPKPPIMIGITIKKIMIKACAVTMTL
jgi:hypothetical protein